MVTIITDRHIFKNKRLNDLAEPLFSSDPIHRRKDIFMHNSSKADGSQQIGYLVIKVSTARGAIPLKDASVSIRGAGQSNSGVIYSLTTDRDGVTPKVELPTPELYYSESPDNPIPYALYNIDVFKDGYTPMYFNNVPVFPSVISVQPAVMIPLSEGGEPTTVNEINVNEESN